MNTLPLISLIFILLIGCSAFLSLAESMMKVANPRRLHLMGGKGARGAQKAIALLEQPEQSFKALLVAQILSDISAALLAAYISMTFFLEENVALAVGILTALYILLLLAKSLPKTIGLTISPVYADKFFLIISNVLSPLLKLTQPVTFLVNAIEKPLLHFFYQRRFQGKAPRPIQKTRLSTESDNKNNISQGNQGLFHNLAGLEQISVEDIMTPRANIEAIDIELPVEEIIHRLGTAYHSRLPVYRNEFSEVLGIAHMRRLFSHLQNGQLSAQTLENSLSEPYYVPAATPVLEQLQFFQETKNRLAFVVDEYGEILGLVTLEDIAEEIIGEFTTSQPGNSSRLTWDSENNSVLVEGSRSLREINRKLGLQLPMDGPKTLNGLVLEHFRDIPEPGISIKIVGIPIEIVQTQGKSVKIARIFKPHP